MKIDVRKNIFMPEMKISINQLIPIKSVCPISGWRINKLETKIINRNDIRYFKFKFVNFCEQIIKQMTTIKKGFTNSTGCILGKIIKSIHLLEPFISTPTIGTKNKRIKDKQKIIIDNL